MTSHTWQKKKSQSSAASATRWRRVGQGWYRCSHGNKQQQQQPQSQWSRRTLNPAGGGVEPSGSISLLNDT